MTAVLTQDPPEFDTARLAIPPGAGTHRPAVSREEARAAVPVGQRPRLRTRNAVDDLHAPLRQPRLRQPRPCESAPHRRVHGRGCRGRLRRWPSLAAPRRVVLQRSVATDARVEPVHAHHRAGRRGDVAEPVARWRHRRVLPRAWAAAGTSIRSASAGATPRRSSTIRKRDERGAGVLARRIAHRLSRVGRRRRHFRRRARPANRSAV